MILFTLQICGFGFAAAAMQSLAEAVSLPQCKGPYPSIEMRETVAGQMVVCDGTRQTGRVELHFTGLGGGRIAICPAPSSCTSDSPLFATATRNTTSSTAIFTGQATRAGHGTLSVVCRLFVNSDELEASCPLDVIYGAEISTPSCSVRVMTNGNSWFLEGGCSITKAFSSRDRYSCFWVHRTPDGASSQIPAAQTSATAPVMVPGTESKPYYNFNCSFHIPLPQLAGTHVFSATAFPGQVVGPSNTFVVALPATTHDCPSTFQKAGDTMTCTCSLTSVGSPQGVARWQSSGTSELSRTLRAEDNSRQYVCQAMWGSTVVSHTNYTPFVAHGPSSVTVMGPPSLVDTNGQTSVTLTCQPSTSTPPVLVYTWRRLSGGPAVGSQKTLNLTAARNGDGVTYQCTATNSQFSDLSASGTYTLDLNYPPDSDPVIDGYNIGDVKYAGDPLTMTCVITGGKPVADTRVHFSCPGKSDADDDVGTTDVRSSLEFRPLQFTDDNVVCTCSGGWKNYTDWYTATVQRTLVVYYSPSAPRIDPPSTSYPFIAGETSSAHVTCVSDTVGQPPVSYTWTSTAGGQPGATGTLTFDTVNSDLNGVNITCRAWNNFTVYKNTPLTQATLQLEVYYHPRIQLTMSESNQCTLTPDGRRCDVREGNNISIHCSSDSNPPPASTVWYKADSVRSGEELRVTSTDDVRDTGVYSCQSTTGSLAYNHPPLTSTRRLNVLVTFAARDLNVTVNNGVTKVIVNEGDDVMVTCTARGRPAPSISLHNNSLGVGQLLASRDGGEMTINTTVTSLLYEISPAQCSHTDTYTCIARNTLSEGHPLAGEVTVSVLCRPRQVGTSDQDRPSVNYIDRPVQLSVRLLAFPLPSFFSFLFLGTARNMTVPVTDDRLDIHCWQASTVYDVICNVIVDNITPAEAGFYTVDIGNNVSTPERILFEIKYNDTTAEGQGEESGSAAGTNMTVVAGITVAVMLLLFVVMVAVAVWWMWRRHWTLPCAAGPYEESHSDSRKEASTAAHSSDPPNNGEHGFQGREDQEEPAVPNNYDELRLQEVGLRSVYSEISPYSDTGARGDNSERGPVYENSGSAQTSPYSNVHTA